MFGEKWTFNHNIKIVKNKSYFEILEGDGFRNRYTKEKNLEEAKKASVARILIAQKKADVKQGGLKANSVYKELEAKLLKDESFRESQEEKLGSSAALIHGDYYSWARGPSTLTYRTNDTFVRTFQNGSTEEFNAKGQLIKTSDRAKNGLTYTYQGDNLSKILDTCGRSITFTYQTDPKMRGLIKSLKDTLNRTVTFEFDASKYLKSFVATNGERVEYTYDKLGNLRTLASIPPGSKEPNQKIELSYNSKYEVEERKEKVVTEENGIKKISDTKLTYKRSFVADDRNHSITETNRFALDPKTKTYAKVNRELYENKVKEFEMTTRFDARGKEISRETKKMSPLTGFPVSILDAKGRGEMLDYDPASGNLIKRTEVPSGEIQEFGYDKVCTQQVNEIINKNPQGVVTSKINFNFDPRCNLKTAKQKKGTKSEIDMKVEYNSKGKIAFIREGISKREVAFTYWNYGKPDSITLKDVGTLLVTYLNSGEIEKVDTYPHGTSKAKYKGVSRETYQGPILSQVKQTLDEFLGFLKPAGLNIGL